MTATDIAQPSAAAKHDHEAAYQVVKDKVKGGLTETEALWRLGAGASEIAGVFRRGEEPSPRLATTLGLVAMLDDLPPSPAGGDAVVTISVGGSKEDKRVQRKTCTWARLCEVLTNHKIGAKDGPCVLPAVFQSDTRGNMFAEQIDTLILDSDAGQPLDVIEKAVLAQGWTAIIHSTHSHLTTETMVRRTAYTAWAEAHPGKSAADYLLDQKGYLPAVAVGAAIDGGSPEFVRLRHPPCPKYRIVLRLAKPWRATDYDDPAAAASAWKAAIAGAADVLGLNYDESCTDRARLFYLPRHPEGVRPVSRVYPGRPCDVWSLPGVQAPKRATAAPARPSAPAEPQSFVDPHTGKTFDLTKWAATSATRFLIVEALRNRRPAVFRGHVAETKHHIECPFVDEHSDPTPDRATFVCDAGAGQGPGFVVHCMHGHCKNRDRLAFVRQMLEDGWLELSDLADDRFLLPAPDAVEAAVDRLNGELAVVRVSGKTLVVREHREEVTGRRVTIFERPEETAKWFRNDVVEIEKAGARGKTSISVSVFDIWMKHGRRRQYERVVFAPGLDVPGALNLWRGSPVVPSASGSCDLLLEHLRENVCGGNPELFRYLFGYFAHLAQRPWEKPGVAIVLVGGRGTGKSKVGEVFRSLWPDHSVNVDHRDRLLGRFNKHMDNVVLIQSDEMFFAADPQGESTIKSMITATTRQVEAKGLDASTAEDFSRFIFTSNEDWVVPAGEDERRFFVMKVGDGRKQDTAFFRAMDEQLDAGGREHLMHLLLAHDLNGFDVHTAPATEDLFAQKIASLGSAQRWIFDALQDGSFGRGEPWPETVRMDDLHQAYAHAFRNERYARIQPKQQFGLTLSRTIGLGKPRRPYAAEGSRARVYDIPPIEDARRHFERWIRHAVDWGRPGD